MEENHQFVTLDHVPHQTSSEVLIRERLQARVRSIVRSGIDVKSFIPALNLSYIERPQKVSNCFYVLSVGLILSGQKRLTIADKTYHYGTGTMVVTSMDMPTAYELLNVTPASPFVSLSYRLDPAILTELLLESGDSMTSASEAVKLGEPSLELLEDFDRLLRLLEHPEQIKVRAPLLIRDIHILALSYDSGACLRAHYVPDSIGSRIRKAIRWMRDNFRQPLPVEKLAEIADMAPATFHRHFKTLTSYSPRQYQKRLRLYEAQQFLLRGEGDVNSAAYAVGYSSPQQFNRDYKNLFGMSPGKRLKEQRGVLDELPED